MILDVAGNPAGGFAGSINPALHNGMAFYVNAGTLSAVDIQSSTLKWSFSGDGALCTSPVVAGAGGQVFIGSNLGHLYEVDENTGAQRSVHDAGTDLTCFSENNSMALGNDHLLVPVGNSLVVY